MNIAIPYHFDENKPDKWNTPIGLGKAFEKKGHTIKYFSINPKQCNFSKLISESNNYDFIFFCWCGPSYEFDQQLQLLKSKTKTKIFLELGDEPQTHRDNQTRINYVDAFFTPDLRCHKNYLERNLPSNWMTHWCDDEIFYRKPEIQKENICVTSCIGYRPLLHELQQKYGDKFVNQHVWGYDNTDYFNRGSITYQFARFDEITRRLFESGGCGNAIITNRISPDTGIYDLFIDDEDIAFFSTQQECYDKMDRLFTDSEYRNRLATNMYNKITKYHLVGNRVDQILQVFSKS